MTKKKKSNKLPTGIEQRGKSSYRYRSTIKNPITKEIEQIQETINLPSELDSPEEVKHYLNKEIVNIREKKTLRMNLPKELIKNSNTDELIKDIAEKWIEINYGDKLSKKTYSNHLSRLNVHILPVIGDLTPRDLGPTLLIDLINNLRNSKNPELPLSYESKKDIYETLDLLCTWMHKMKYISVYLMEMVPKPVKPNKVSEDHIYYFSDDEMDLIEYNLSSQPHYWEAAGRISIATGLRRGEIAALEWKHINFEKETILIEQSLVPSKNGVQLKGPKTPAAYRELNVPSDLIAYLKTYKEIWDRNKSYWGKKWLGADHEFIITANFGKHIYPTSLDAWWKKYLSSINVDHRNFHHIRHTFVCTLVKEGIDIITVSMFLGHKDFSTTLAHYSKTMRPNFKACAKVIANRKKKSSTKNIS